MGADLLLSWTPFCASTAERQEEFTASLRQLPDAELVDECKDSLWGLLDDREIDYKTNVSGAAQFIRSEMLRVFCEVGENRECCGISFSGMDYQMLITGGMSWGDAPTESMPDIDTLGAVPADTYRLLEKWAKEDFAKLRQPTSAPEPDSQHGKYQRLVDAAHEVLKNACDSGSHGPGSDAEPEAWDLDEDGDAWYGDFWELKEALAAVESKED